jgi:hypothetical protein
VVAYHAWVEGAGAGAPESSASAAVLSSLGEGEATDAAEAEWETLRGRLLADGWLRPNAGVGRCVLFGGRFDCDFRYVTSVLVKKY